MKKLLLILLPLLLILQSCNSLSPEKQALTGPWKLKYDPERIGLRQGWFNTDLDRSDWVDTKVPGYWADGDYTGFAWYNTEVQANTFPAGYNLAIVFDSIDDNAVIWLDGRLFGKQLGHDVKFYYDIGDKLADRQAHELTVRIENTGGPGGINGAVYLEPYLIETDLLRTEASKQLAPPAPAWAQNAALYEVFVRDHTAAGTFSALRDDLDRIQALGVDIIWLMPIQPLGKKNAKGSLGSPYSIRDYYNVNPDFGTLQDFKELVAAVHAQGMHIILDFVLNHSSWDNDLLAEHPDWYTHNAAGEIISPNADWTDVADFNYDKPALRTYMLKLLRWWLQETGIDGYRFDVAELVPNTFWALAKADCQQIKPDVFFLAEGAQPELHLNGHDMTYSWNMWAGVTQLAQGVAEPTEVKRSFDQEKYQYPQGALRLRFTENHDKARSHHVIPNADQNMTAWALIALMPGDPLIYAGQEVGATHQPSLFAREPIDWQAGSQQVAEMMTAVLKLRKQYLKPGAAFQILLADNARQVMAYRHGPLLSFYNFSADTFSFSAAGMDTILYGGLVQNADSTLSLLPHKFGVIK